ncbi:MAG: cation diffusion facilitator family transporter [Bdellovibrionales bacterium]
MSDSCCDSKTDELKVLAKRQAKILWIVLAINLIMFFLEGFYGVLAGSTSLLADSLDMLGDAFVYGISIYAIGRSIKWGASTSLIKGSIMTLFGLGVIGEAIRRFMIPGLPIASTMGIVGTIAMIANFICAILLLHHRNDDLNMRSTWLCSRNDVIANIGVLLAAGAVSLTQSKYPDLIVGVCIAALVLKSSYHVLKESILALR